MKIYFIVVKTHADNVMAIIKLMPRVNCCIIREFKSLWDGAAYVEIKVTSGSAKTLWNAGFFVGKYIENNKL